jgi:hypothetical protein
MVEQSASTAGNHICLVGIEQKVRFGFDNVLRHEKGVINDGKVNLLE